MRKNANQDGSTAPPTEPCDDQKGVPQHVGPETTAHCNVAGEMGTPELEAYLAHLADLDIPLPTKIELIRALQQIMQSFVDRAFGDDPAQLACKANVRSDSNVP